MGEIQFESREARDWLHLAELAAANIDYGGNDHMLMTRLTGAQRGRIMCCSRGWGQFRAGIIVCGDAVNTGRGVLAAGQGRATAGWQLRGRGERAGLADLGQSRARRPGTRAGGYHSLQPTFYSWTKQTTRQHETNMQMIPNVL